MKRFHRLAVQLKLWNNISVKLSTKALICKASQIFNLFCGKTRALPYDIK